MKVFLIISVGLTLSGGILFAQDFPTLKSNPGNGTGEPERPMSQGEMNQEALKFFEQIDKELNIVWKQIMPAMEKHDSADLKKAQLAWLKYRDGYAEAVANYNARGGSMWSMIYHGVRARLTRQRVQMLKMDYLMHTR